MYAIKIKVHVTVIQFEISIVAVRTLQWQLTLAMFTGPVSRTWLYIADTML